MTEKQIPHPEEVPDLATQVDEAMALDPVAQVEAHLNMGGQAAAEADEFNDQQRKFHESLGQVVVDEVGPTGVTSRTITRVRDDGRKHVTRDLIIPSSAFSDPRFYQPARERLPEDDGR